ncbi:MAG: DUF3025 domain-containing protein [Dokdonella sp.]
MRYLAPARDSIDVEVLARPPLSSWCADHGALLRDHEWPDVEQLDAARACYMAEDGIERPNFVKQTPILLADGLHYEQRIAAGRIATRSSNWHDLLNGLVWLRYPLTKRALNRRQSAAIEEFGPRTRTRAQCAMTHFDEGGAVVLCADPNLISLWDAHDWHALFVDARERWKSHAGVFVFGHATLEHALTPGQMLVAKALVLNVDPAEIGVHGEDDHALRQRVDRRIGELIDAGDVLVDPQELRPLPLSGIPGWHGATQDDAFYLSAPCFRPLRAGRRYPAAQLL